ncbi:hypothetical protein Goshw_017144 [Gossypium schwendimanii]|uniref:DUF4283 domain-containing protein n=1 Tax=Gossypium schwendimanii TaxID=34291 RepID=A0A7J9MNZ4_GOSSC|nr:hypothetical protein [Gossypium schwendimanii]
MSALYDGLQVGAGPRAYVGVRIDGKARRWTRNLGVGGPACFFSRRLARLGFCFAFVCLICVGSWLSGSVVVNKPQSYEAWAMGKLMSEEKINKNTMYRVFRSLWFTKENINFVELKEGMILVKFGTIEDRRRILNLSPWPFDQCLFAMLPYEKNQDLDDYRFNIVPYWLRIFNIPLEFMDRQVALDVGKAIGEVVAIDWRDGEGRWTEYIRVRVKIDV